MAGLVDGRNKEKVAVIDSGFNLEHPLFKGKMDAPPGYDYADDDGDLVVEPEFGLTEGTAQHGSNVMGIALRGTGQLIGYAAKAHPTRGTLPQSIEEFRATIVPFSTAIAKAFDGAATRGARVINLSASLALPDSEAARKEATDRLKVAIERHPDVLFVLAAGNDHAELGTGMYSPSLELAANHFDNVLVIAGADTSGAPASYTNFSREYAGLGAVGEFRSAGAGTGWIQEAGTSQAAPNASNAAAKCLLLNPSLTPKELIGVLTATVDRSTAWDDKVASGGVLNTKRAMTLSSLLALVEDGSDLAKAADRLGLEGEERDRLIEAASRTRPRLAQTPA